MNFIKEVWEVRKNYAFRVLINIAFISAIVDLFIILVLLPNDPGPLREHSYHYVNLSCRWLLIYYASIVIAMIGTVINRSFQKGGAV